MIFSINILNAIRRFTATAVAAGISSCSMPSAVSEENAESNIAEPNLTTLSQTNLPSRFKMIKYEQAGQVKYNVQFGSFGNFADDADFIHRVVEDRVKNENPGRGFSIKPLPPIKDLRIYSITISAGQSK